MRNVLSRVTESRPDASGSRSASVVFAGIFLSRVLGLVRNTLFARYFGSGAEADAFNAASKIPGLLRNLLGEGTLSASFVPVYSRLLAKSDAGGKLLVTVLKLHMILDCAKCRCLLKVQVLVANQLSVLYRLQVSR